MPVSRPFIQHQHHRTHAAKEGIKCTQQIAANPMLKTKEHHDKYDQHAKHEKHDALNAARRYALCARRHRAH